MSDINFQPMIFNINSTTKHFHNMFAIHILLRNLVFTKTNTSTRIDRVFVTICDNRIIYSTAQRNIV